MKKTTREFRKEISIKDQFISKRSRSDIRDSIDNIDMAETLFLTLPKIALAGVLTGSREIAVTVLQSTNAEAAEESAVLDILIDGNTALDQKFKDQARVLTDYVAHSFTKDENKDDHLDMVIFIRALSVEKRSEFALKAETMKIKDGSTLLEAQIKVKKTFK